jgi:hypothetical protein
MQLLSLEDNECLHDTIYHYSSGTNLHCFIRKHQQQQYHVSPLKSRDNCRHVCRHVCSLPPGSCQTKGGGSSSQGNQTRSFV